MGWLGPKNAYSPIGGQDFQKGCPLMYMPMGVHGPVGAPAGENVTRKQPSGAKTKRKRQAVGKTDPKTVQRGN